jgi:hypothetical protein
MKSKLMFLALIQGLSLPPAHASKLICHLGADGVEGATSALVNARTQVFEGALKRLKAGEEVALVDSLESGAPFGQLRIGSFLKLADRSSRAILSVEELNDAGERTEVVLASLELDARLLARSLGAGVALRAKLSDRQKVVVPGDDGGVYLWADVRCSTEGRAN